MAILMTARTPEEVKNMGVAATRVEYNKLASVYTKITECDYCFCHKCSEFKSKQSFYSDAEYSSGVFPLCKECLLDMATDYDKKEKTHIDNKDKTKKVFQMMDLPFYDDLYASSIESVSAKLGEKTRSTAYQQMLVMIKSLVQYRDKHWKDSIFNDEDTVIVKDNRTARKEIKKIFGSGLSETDYLFLQDTYDDFRARTQVDSISQEIYVKQICMSLLEIDKDRKNGKDVTNKLKSLDILMNSAALQPKQNMDNSVSDNLSFGQLIEKWEQEKPIPEPDEEFKDVNKIGKFIRVFFSGHLAKSIGLNNCYSQEYDEEMNKYSVYKSDASEDVVSDDIYNLMFGSKE